MSSGGRQPSQGRGFGRGHSRGRGDHNTGSVRSPSVTSNQSGRGSGSIGERGRGGQGRTGSRGGGRASSQTSATSHFQNTPAAVIYGGTNGVAAINTRVAELEEKTFDVDTSLQLLSLSDEARGPIRPAYGTAGTSCTLWTNYFDLSSKENTTFYRYDVTVIDNKKTVIEGRKKLERCLSLLLTKLPTGIQTATDFSKILITSAQYPFTDRTYTFPFFYEDQSESDTSPTYQARVVSQPSFTLADLMEYLSSTDLGRPQPTNTEEILQALNIVVGFGLRSDAEVFAKKNKYFPGTGSYRQDRNLVNCLKAYRGFLTSVRPATGRLLLNVQVQHAVTWQALPLPDLLHRLLSVDRLSAYEVHKMIAGMMVDVSLPHRRTKKVLGFALENDGQPGAHPPKVPRNAATPREVLFWKDEPAPGRMISIADYFVQVNGSPLRFPDLPVLNMGSKIRPVYIPSELCTVKPFQFYNKKLSPDQTDKIRDFAVRSAPTNARTIAENGAGLLLQKCDTIAGKFGVSFDLSDLVTVPGRILPGVRIQYAGNQSVLPEEASWNMRGIKFHQAVTLPKWTYLRVRTQFKSGACGTMQELQPYIAELQNMMIAHGIKVPNPSTAHECIINNPDADIDQAFSRLKSEGVKLVVVVLHERSTPIYNAIKRAGDIKFGIHTIAVVGSPHKFCKPGNKMFCANVALKINLKLGGRNQVLANENLGFVSAGKTMLVGLDVTHPSPGSAENAPSVSCITASVDRYLSQWPADVKTQTGRKEIIGGLEKMFHSRLVLWQKHNAQLPEEIIIYRDGVGEGMYNKVRNEELPLIRKACASIYPATQTQANKPLITMIICGKRHHTRFYPTDTKDTVKGSGTRNGTIVDKGITESRVWDFFFQAHKALQGTPRSSHYVVVHDEVFRRRFPGAAAVDQLEKLTNALSHLYGRATKAVSLCPPAYYADIACERARVWLSRAYDGTTSNFQLSDAEVQIHADLKDTMFYI